MPALTRMPSNRPGGHRGGHRGGDRHGGDRRGGVSHAGAILRNLCIAAFVLAALPASAQNCTRAGSDVTCDDGRHGLFTGDSIIWTDGTQSRAAAASPSVIIGNKPSVFVGPGVFVGNGKGGKVPLDDPSKKRCAVLDSVNFCN